MSIPSQFDPLGKSLLPAGYKRVNYLESTGTQKIIMPLISDQVNVTTEHIYTLINPYKSCVEMWQNTLYFGINANGGFYFNNKTSGNHQTEKVAKVGERYKILLNETGLTINGIFTPLPRGDVERPEFNTLGIFSAQNGDYQCWLKKYYWIEELNYKIVRNLIPCLDPQNRPCMFDLVTRTPFYNQGTGEFLYG